jgi:hypothetical protein
VLILLLLKSTDSLLPVFGKFGLVKEFTKTESKRKQRFLRSPLKKEMMVAATQRSIACRYRDENRFHISG